MLFNVLIITVIILLKNIQNIQPKLSKQLTLMLFCLKTSNKTWNVRIQYDFCLFFSRVNAFKDAVPSQREIDEMTSGPLSKNVNISICTCAF